VLIRANVKIKQQNKLKIKITAQDTQNIMKNCFLKTNKFRAWYKPDFKEEGGPFLFELKVIDDTPYFVMKGDKQCRYEFQYVLLDGDWIIERGTGLKDNKNKEIFEGDILLSRNDFDKEDVIQKVEYYDGMFCWDWYKESFKNNKGEYRDCDLHVGLYINQDNVEIIGNIHQNNE